MARSASVLMYGRDSTLLRYRSLVVETIVDSVTATLSKESAISTLESVPVDLLILCQTVPQEECDDFVKMVKTKWPWTKVLTLQSVGPAYSQSVNVTRMNPLEGPARLLEQVDDLLREKARVIHFKSKSKL